MFRLVRRPAGSAPGLTVPGLMAALTAVSVAGLAAPASAARPGSARLAAAAPPVAAHSNSAASPVKQLVLLNGDRLAVTADGRQVVAPRLAAANDALTTLWFGGRRLVIPTAAQPYLGRGLSPSLFDLSALEKAEHGGRLPVDVSFTGGRPAIPGVRVTRWAAGRASGYLTAGSARVFGAALWRQFTADHARGSYGADGMFGGVSITLAGAAPPPAARPAFPMHTLTVHATGPAGRPDTGDFVSITSADNLARFASGNYFYRGAAKFSLPAGHYWALATFLTPTRTGGTLRFAVLPQFTVAGRNTTLHLAARSATSKVTVTTPRPAVTRQMVFEVVRGERTGPTLPYYEWWDPGFRAYVSPTTRKPTVGSLRSYTFATLTSAARVSPGYAYNLDFPGPAGLVPAQHFAVTPADLGTVTEHYYQDVPTTDAGWSMSGGTVAQLNVGSAFGPPLRIRMPQVQTQYFSAGRGLLWSLATFGNVNQLTDSNNDLYRSFSGGERESESWNAFPLHPAPDTTLGGPGPATWFPVLPSAARSGNTLRLSFTPFSDNRFGHTGPGYLFDGSARVAGRYAVAQNGRTIASGNAADGNGIPAIGLSPQPSTIRFTLTASRSGSLFRLSTASRTVWTWHSARDTTARVPAAWYCWVAEVHGQVRIERQCAVQHLMTLRYQVRGMSLTGLARPGQQAVTVTAGHIQLGGKAAISKAAAQVSFNGGHTWSAAKVTALGRGRFKIAYTAPAGAAVTLRVSAADAAGGSISETITRGYEVSR